MSHQWQHVCIDHRRTRAFVFPDLRQQRARHRNGNGRVACTNQVTDTQFVRAVGVRIDEANRNSVDLRGNDLIDDCVRAGFVQRAFDAAQVTDALVDFESEPAGHQRRWFAPADVVENRHAQTADLEHVAKALCCDQGDACALAFENRIGRHGRRVHDLRDLIDLHAAVADDGLEAGCNTKAVVVRRRQHLGAQHSPFGIQEYEVGKSPADIDAEPRFHQRLAAGKDAVEASLSSPIRSAAFRPRMSSLSSSPRKVQCFLT